VRAFAAALGERGLERGQHLAVVGSNRPRLYVAMAAAQCVGAIPVPLHEDASGLELELPIRNAAIAHAVVEDQGQVDKLLELLPRCPSLKHICYEKRRGVRDDQHTMLKSYDELIALGRRVLSGGSGLMDREIAKGEGSDVAAMFYTSGTSGPPKGVVLSYASLIEIAKTVAELEGVTDRDVVFAFMPPAWIGQSIFSYVQPLVVGHSVCCPESAATIMNDLREIGPTYYFAPPRVFETSLRQMSQRMEDAGVLKRKMYAYFMGLARRVGVRILEGKALGLLDRIGYATGAFLVYAPLKDALGMSRVRVAYTGGETIDPDLFVLYRSLGINLKQLYGSTETGFLVCMQRDEQIKADSVGPAVPGVQLKLSPQRELLIKSPGLFKEYYKDPKATAAAKDAQGWFHSGDAGHIDADGHLTLSGRMQDVGTLADGTPFTPRYLENKLKSSPYVKEAVCFGHQQSNVCALINIDEEAVRRWAEKHALAFTSYADLASRDEIYELIAGSVERMNRDLAAQPERACLQIHRFAILLEELNADDEELTRTCNLRRHFVAQKYAPLVKALSAGCRSVQLAARLRDDDGRVRRDSTQPEIREAKMVPCSSGQLSGPSP
jgi:long-chain acyl-CoA synthetase